MLPPSREEAAFPLSEAGRAGVLAPQSADASLPLEEALDASGRTRVPLGADVGVEARLAALAPEARLAVAAEARRRVEKVGAVDPDHARLDAVRHFEREVDVFAPHRAREPVARVVGERDGLGRRAERHRHQRPPKISSCTTAELGETLVSSVGEKVAVAADLVVRKRRLVARGAVGDAAVHPGLDLVALPAVDDGAHVDGLVERRAHAERIHAAAEAL